MALSAAWNALGTGLVPPAALGLVVPPSEVAEPPDESALRAAMEVLRGHGLHAVLEEWFLEVLQMDLQGRVAPEFWAGLAQRENAATEPQSALLLLEAFSLLGSRLAPYLRSLALMEAWAREGLLLGTGARPLQERVHAMLRAILFFSTPGGFQETLRRFYARSFKIYMLQQRRQWQKRSQEPQESVIGEESEQEGLAEGMAEALGGGQRPCAGCEEEEERCWCPVAMNQFQQLNDILQRLNLLERVSADAVTSILHQMIEERMERRCRGEYERSFLSEFHEWIEKVIGWLSQVFLQGGSGAPPSPEASSTLKRWRCHVQMFFYRQYASMRIEELFSIIRDFPESKLAVEDLKYCLERTNQRQQLLSSLKSALEMRLLHPGVNTSDIITLYISAIKALRELDPSMVILEVACEPIRKYLRTREDTVRQIVAGLTGDAEGSGDLANELSKADPVTLENGQESDDDISDPEDWVPDPVDADPGKSSSKRRSSDIISLLVSIYGSKDLFISEYRNLLADRLLHQFSYSTEREIRNVELLKLRFGEAQMHYCEVMLKDMADSRRINTNIRDEEQKLPEEERPPFNLTATILSSEFWPPLKEEKLELPEEIKEAMKSYSKKYEKLKAMRTLNWKPHLGLVNLEVELADRTLALSVSPVHAAIILHFQSKDAWMLDELSEVLKVPLTSLRRKMTLWVQQGVLREDPPGTFMVIEEEQKDRPEKVVLIDSDEEGDSATASQADQKEEELQVFWTYIQAMLTNLESLSLERIHSMLKLFVMTGPMVTEIDIQELQGFLQKKVRDQQLIYSAVKISRAEIPHGFDLLLNGSNEGETEDNDIIVRRAVRKYPEDSEDIGIGHRQASIRVSPVECNCPEVLAKGTLVAIVAALAFLSFFSITILLVVAICILRLVEKQKKKEKEEKPARSSHRRLVPPVPPPRPEHTYMTVQPLHGYERLHPASPRAARGIYLSASELHPGPRVHREKGYQSASVTPPGAKSTRENEYIGPDPAPSLSTPPLDKSYTSADKTGSQTGSIQDTVRSPLLSPKGRDNHIYEEVE